MIRYLTEGLEKICKNEFNSSRVAEKSQNKRKSNKILMESTNNYNNGWDSSRVRDILRYCADNDFDYDKSYRIVINQMKKEGSTFPEDMKIFDRVFNDTYDEVWDEIDEREDYVESFRANRKRLKEVYDNPRHYTDKLYDMIEDNLVNVEELAKDLIYWVSEDDIKEFMAVRDLLDDEDEDIDESLNKSRKFESLNPINKQMQTERGLVYVVGSYPSEQEAIKDGYAFAFKSYDLGKKLYSKITSDINHREFVIIDESLTEANLHPRFKKELKRDYKRFDRENDAIKNRRKELRNNIDAMIKIAGPSRRGLSADEIFDAYTENNPEFTLKKFKMRLPKTLEKYDYPYYVTFYEEYPIYEPAEGGYYYAGTEARSSRGFDSIEEARSYLNKVKNDMIEVGDGNPTAEMTLDKSEFKLPRGLYGYHWEGKYIGEDIYVVIEPRNTYLSREKGWEPYQ